MNLNQHDCIMPLLPEGDQHEQSVALAEWLEEEQRRIKANELLDERMTEQVICPEI